MKYEFYHADSDELYHFVKGEKVKFHKYIRREPKKSGKGFVYYYNEAKNAVSSAVSNLNKKNIADPSQVVFGNNKSAADKIRSETAKISANTKSSKTTINPSSGRAKNTTKTTTMSSTPTQNSVPSASTVINISPSSTPENARSSSDGRKKNSSTNKPPTLQERIEQAHETVKEWFSDKLDEVEDWLTRGKTNKEARNAAIKITEEASKQGLVDLYTQDWWNKQLVKTTTDRIKNIVKVGPTEIRSMINDYYKRYNKPDWLLSKHAKEERIDLLRQINDGVLSNLPEKTYTTDSLKERDSDQAAINPNYDPNVYEYSNNCGYCTMAYDMRRRGYDVVAKPAENSEAGTVTTTDFLGVNDQSRNSDDCYMRYDIDGNDRLDPENGAYRVVDMTTDPKWVDRYTRYYNNRDLDSLKQLVTPTYTDFGEELLRNNPDNAYGTINVLWVTGGGHSMVYEVDNREITIRDCQTGEKYTYDAFIEEVGVYTQWVNYTRLDNAVPTENIYRRVEARK